MREGRWRLWRFIGGGGREGSNTQSTRNEHPTYKYPFFALEHLDVSASSSSFFFRVSFTSQANFTFFVATANAHLVPDTIPLKSQDICQINSFVCYLSNPHCPYPQSVVYTTFRYKGGIYVYHFLHMLEFVLLCVLVGSLFCGLAAVLVVGVGEQVLLKFPMHVFVFIVFACRMEVFVLLSVVQGRNGTR